MERLHFDEEWGVSDEFYDRQQNQFEKFMDKVSVLIVSALKLIWQAVKLLVVSTVVYLVAVEPFVGPHVEAFKEGLAGEYVDPVTAPITERTWEEWRASAQEVPYRTLFRYAEDYEGELLYYRGKVVQVIEVEGEQREFQLRVSVTADDNSIWWTDTMFLFYEDAPVRPLEDDIVEFVGWGAGVLTYTSTTDTEITIPSLVVASLIIEEE